MFSNNKDKIGLAKRAGRVFVASFLSTWLAGSTVAQNPRNVPDVTAMSMEDLMNMQVTSVSKRTQKVADAAAAIFVNGDWNSVCAQRLQFHVRLAKFRWQIAHLIG